MLPALNDINQVNVIKEVRSSGALRKMDANVSVESLLPVFRWKRGWKEQVTANCRVSQQEDNMHFPLIFSNFWESHIYKHAYIYTKKRCFSIYIMLSMILQLYGLGNLISGITTAADKSVKDVGGRFYFWYRWRNINFSATAWRTLR